MNPTLFFNTLYSLSSGGCRFRVSVIGEVFSEIPAIFNEAREKLAPHIAHWGYQPSRAAYVSVLQSADVVVSTADHEFFGVAMLEGVIHGCYPLCPNRLAYPEIFPKECLYNTDAQLRKALQGWCKRPDLLRAKKKEVYEKVDPNKYTWETLESAYRQVLD